MLKIDCRVAAAIALSCSVVFSLRAHAAEATQTDVSALRSSKKTLLRLPMQFPDKMVRLVKSNEGGKESVVEQEVPIDSGLAELIRAGFVIQFESNLFRFVTNSEIPSIDNQPMLAKVEEVVEQSKQRWACEEETALRAAQSETPTEPVDCGNADALASLRLERAQVDDVRQNTFAYQTKIAKLTIGTCREREVKNDKGEVVGKAYQCGVNADATLDLWRVKFEKPGAPTAENIGTLEIAMIPKLVFGFSAGSGEAPTEAEAYPLAATNLGESLGRGFLVEMRKRDEFKLRTVLSQARMTPSGIDLDFGTNEGMRVGYGFDVVTFGLDGAKKNVGYVKVAKLGENRTSDEAKAAREAGQPKLSSTDIIADDGIVAGAQVEEHPQYGVNARPFVEVALTSHNVDGNAAPLAFGGGVDLEYDLSGLTSIPELWAQVRVGSQFAPVDSSKVSGILQVGAEVGVAKLFYLRRLQLGVGAFIGSQNQGLLSSIAGSEMLQGRAVGGRLGGTIGYFVTPDFHIGAGVGGRFYAAPGTFTANDVEFSADDIGVQANPTGITTDMAATFLF